MMENCRKYRPGYYPVPAEYNDWVNKDHVEKAPIWCSVDLRDGNQALIVPMNLQQKLDFFRYLCEIGFKEIEVGFPAASDTEYELVRALIEQDLIPDDVTIQVLTQSRRHIIEKTFDSLIGCRNAIVHLYNSTSTAQREQVFGKSKEGIKEIAVEGARLLKEIAADEKYRDTNIRFEYSPESFTGTEPEYALEVCNAVLDVWNPDPEHKAIVNIPATVEMSMPHVFASQISYMNHNLRHRENTVLSIHPHNDRGTGVADAELGMLAGADRVEGTLFGNGERTGNVDIITIAMNMYTHGVDPMLDFTDMPTAVENYESWTGMTVEPRHPYCGDLVFAAFSGSHQDAIAKGMRYRREHDPNRWTVPYLPIDPHDVGREYDGDVIRINSQSGKGGVAYVIERDHGFQIPKAMRAEVGYMMKDISDRTQEELSADRTFDLFREEYINDFKPLDIQTAVFTHDDDTHHQGEGIVKVDMHVDIAGDEFDCSASGNGRLDAVSKALRETPYNFGGYKFVTYSEHALSPDSNSQAAAYVCIADESDEKFWGVGTHDDIILASVNALVSALNRMNKVRPFIR